MKKKILFNKINREELKQELAAEPFNRNTASFYRYNPIADPQAFRDELYLNWDDSDDRDRILKKQFSPDNDLIIFDELHKYSEWKNYIKG